MSAPTWDDLRDLMARSAPHCVSLFLPTHRSGRDGHDLVSCNRSRAPNRGTDTAPRNVGSRPLLGRGERWLTIA